MGIDPLDETYTEADDPGACELLLFDGRTPKFIEVYVSDIVLCPIATTPDPNGTYVLTQVGPLLWNYEDTDRFMQLELRFDRSFFAIFGRPGLQSLFQDTKARCIDLFQNDQIDCNLPNYGRDGQMTFFWGPGISL